MDSKSKAKARIVEAEGMFNKEASHEAHEDLYQSSKEMSAVIYALVFVALLIIVTMMVSVI